MTETKPLRDFSAFKGWYFRPLTEKKVLVWAETRCDQCNRELLRHAYVLSATEQEVIHSGVLKRPDPPSQEASTAFAGGPSLCPAHYQHWLEGKILPTEDRI